MVALINAGRCPLVFCACAMITDSLTSPWQPPRLDYYARLVNLYGRFTCIIYNLSVSEDTPSSRALLKLHSGLRKAEGSVLVQACTGRTGLAKFLYSRKVTGIISAQCRCRAGEETPRHMALYCIEETGRPKCLRTGKQVDYRQLIGTNSGAKRLAEWLICSGRLGQFSLARRLLYS